MKFDVVIAGARCAGAATALLVARAGGRVLVLDKGGYGTDTLSTHALMRGAVMQLHRWGLLPALTFAATPPIRSTTFSYESLQITIPIEPKFGVSALYAPRSLNEPVVCSFSHLRKTSAPATSLSDAERTSGVRATTPRSRCAAAMTSAGVGIISRS